MAKYLEAWQLRLDALRSLLGPEDPRVFTAVPPLYLGGGADVMTFRNHLPGVVYITGGLTGVDGTEQRHNQQGHTYELMICTPQEARWAARLISQLARYTFDAALNPGETMDCPVLPGSSIKALLFASPKLPGPLRFGGAEHDVLLCVGITPDELRRCRTTGSEAVLADLESRSIFPFTDVDRS